MKPQQRNDSRRDCAINRQQRDCSLTFCRIWRKEGKRKRESEIFFFPFPFCLLKKGTKRKFVSFFARQHKKLPLLVFSLSFTPPSWHYHRLVAQSPFYLPAESSEFNLVDFVEEREKGSLDFYHLCSQNLLCFLSHVPASSCSSLRSQGTDSSRLKKIHCCNLEDLRMKSNWF